MAVTAYSQQSVNLVSFGGGAPQVQPVHLSYDNVGQALSMYIGLDSPAAARLVSAVAQSGNNVVLTMPSSLTATMDAGTFSELLGYLVTKIYGNGIKSLIPDRTTGILFARLGLAGIGTALANL